MSNTSNNDIFVILPNIRSTYNVGSIFRTADAFGVKKIYLTGYTPTPKHPKLAKVSLGAEKSVDWEYKKQTARVLQDLKKKGFFILALEQAKNSVYLKEIVPKYPLAIVLGNEVNGIPKKYLKLCDEVVEIEMKGVKESLNVSVAFGILISHVI